MTTKPLARRSELRLRADPSRVAAGLFVAGQEVVGGSESRASGVVERILALEEDVVVARLDELRRRFSHRHRDLEARFSQHADRIGNRLDAEAELSEERWLLLGATFTHEYSVEAAALCNPSVVPHPDQSGLSDGALRFVMSVRGIGEGHRSSIGFRVGTVIDGEVAIDPTGPYVVASSIHPSELDREVFHAELRALGADGESAAAVLQALGPRFTGADLDAGIQVLAGQRDTRRNVAATVERLRSIADRSYRAAFPVDSQLAERVLRPSIAIESNGLEDARFVRFVDESGAATYLATYTAYDGAGIRQQLLRTDDFLDFAISPLVGQAASNKGLALFPRRIGGRFAALSRADRETNAVAFSDSIGVWSEATTVQAPGRDWDLVQIGNCGPPIETDDGWLVLTHGVGPMRVYAIGAILLDLDDPTQVVASLPGPLLEPEPDEQDGYVPNVVYSCGSLLHDDTLVVPYGIADCAIGFATVSWQELRAAMR
jgi:predicted GH43/DUF377 family glycosyl hydrolase